ncbi:MAG TPA: ABC transporter substrate-binding protein [Acidimicrobiia bacterium]|nr:ABC transporter substrate-binding protein [Acidimicrobiia bacterium]
MNVRGSTTTPRGTRLAAIGLVVATATAMLVGSVSPALAAGTPTASAKSPKPGGEITYGLEAETAGGWCPTSARLAISGIMVENAIYDTLTTPNTKGEIVPYLAKSVEPNADNTVWTITLRDGVKFHDGTPVDAAAVAANIAAYKENLLVGAGLKNIASVTVDSPTQLTVTTGTAWPEFPWFLYLDGRMGIAAPAQLANPDTCPTNLIGSGPFKLAGERVVNQPLVTAKNPDYWQKDAKGTQLPYLDKLTFVPVREATQRVSSLQGGQLDVIHTSDGQQVDQLNQLKSQFNLMVEKPGRREVRYYLMNAQKPPLDDLDARKAVAMAIDLNQVNELRNNGVYTVAHGPFDTSVMGYLKNPGFPKYNPKESKKLVDAYKAAHDGQFSVVLEHTDDPANSAEAQLLKEQLAKVGIDSTLKGEDQTAFILSAVSGNFSIMLWRNHPGDDPDANYQWWENGSLLNFNHFVDADMQALLDQGRASTDPAERKKIYQDVNKLFSEKLYNVWAYYSAWTIAAQKNVQGLAGPPLPDGEGQPLFIYGRHPLLGIYLSQ